MPDYSYHLGIYSKLIRGRTSSGPIKPGVEAKLVGATRDFPDKYEQLCTTSLFFPENPPVTKMDARCMEGGAFVYAPVFLGGEHLSVFGRIEARPERGKGQGGRKFVHSATLIVRDKWEPGLIKWAARMLFTDQYGEHCWGDAIYEAQEGRMSLAPPPLSRYSFPDEPRKERNLKGLDDLAEISRIRLPAPDRENDSEQVPGQVDVADWLAEELEHSGFGDADGTSFAVQGRFLSFACGISDDINGPGNGGFFISLDTRKTEVIVKEAPLAFNDMRPPFYAAPNSGLRNPIIPPWRHLRPFDSKRDKPSSDTLSFEKNYWPDQLLDFQVSHRNDAGNAEEVTTATSVPAVAEQADLPQHDAPRQLDNRAAFMEEPGFFDQFVADANEELHSDAQNTLASYPDAIEPEPIEIDGPDHITPSETAPYHDEAPYDDHSYNDEIDWPILLKYEELPSNLIYPVSREMLDEIGRGFSQLCKRLALIEEQPFDFYPSDDPIDRIIIGKFRQLIELLVDFSAAGRDPNTLRGDLEQLFKHPSLPGIGVQTEDGSSLLRQLFIWYVTNVGEENLLAGVDEMGRRERNLAAYQSKRDGRNIQVDIPNIDAVRRFLSWLKDAAIFNPVDPVYNEMRATWWELALMDYFVELHASSRELFGQKE